MENRSNLKEEIQNVIDILNRPITVNNINLKCFDAANYDCISETFQKCVDIIPVLDDYRHMLDDYHHMFEYLKDNDLWEGYVAYRDSLNDDKRTN